MNGVENYTNRGRGFTFTNKWVAKPVLKAQNLKKAKWNRTTNEWDFQNKSPSRLILKKKKYPIEIKIRGPSDLWCYKLAYVVGHNTGQIDIQCRPIG